MSDVCLARPQVVIVANGGANVASLQYALQRLGADSELTADPVRIRGADRVILPGVGAAADAMQRLRDLALDSVIVGLRQPVLGICLGMQILFEASDEGGAQCLGVLAGNAERFNYQTGFAVPHMGWNTLTAVRESPLLEGIAPGAYAYFVHSYSLPLGPATIAASDYSRRFSACVQLGNFFGVQFHPERSAATGARILDNFLRIH